MGSAVTRTARGVLRVAVEVKGRKRKSRMTVVWAVYWNTLGRARGGVSWVAALVHPVGQSPPPPPSLLLVWE
jgi:hypothetical protein